MTNNKIARGKDFVIQLYCIVDDLLKIIRTNQLSRKRRGRKGKFTESEAIVIACLRWKSKSSSWKAFYLETFPRYHSYFEEIPNYKNFLETMHRVSPLALQLFQLLMFISRNHEGKEETHFIDSCLLEVCHVKRAKWCKLAKGFASKKKSSMGWFYGFKLHAICNEKHEIVSLQITTGSADDRNPVRDLVKNLQGLIVADAGYLGEELQKNLKKMGIHLMAAARKNMKKLMTQVEHLLLKKRQSIERVFSVIKTRFGLRISLARSITGVFVMLFSLLFWYQLNLLSVE